MADEPQAPKKTGHRWKKGKSGNPGGRPRTIVEIAHAIRTAEAAHVPEVVAAMRRLALGEIVAVGKDGSVYSVPPDPRAAALYLDRVMGRAREVEPADDPAKANIRKVLIEYEPA